MLKRAVLYLRYSSDKQTEQSIEGQRDVCRSFCEREGYTVISEYIDRATSASKSITKRTEFLRMIEDSKKHCFDVVIVYKLDRFARNRYDSAKYKAKLKQNDVKLISATEPLSDTPESIILESVLEGMNEYYSAELSQKISRGLNESAKKFQTLGGPSILGLTTDVNKKIVPDENTKHIVIEAFERYANGETVNAIVDSFNKKGYRTVKGRLFTRSSFNKLFTNKKYIGIYTFKGVDYPDIIEPIIKEDVWNKVQERKQNGKRGHYHVNRNYKYLLTGKTSCGECGSEMHGISGTSKNGDSYSYYTCNAKRDGKCRSKNVRQDALERLVLDSALDILTPENMSKIARLVVEENNKELNENVKLVSMENQLKDTTRKKNNLLKSLEEGIISETIVTRIKELEIEERDLERSIEQEREETVVLTEPMVIYWLDKVKESCQTNDRFEQIIIDMLVNSVTVFKDHIVIGFNIGGQQKRTLPQNEKVFLHVPNGGAWHTLYEHKYTLYKGVLFLNKKIPLA